MKRTLISLGLVASISVPFGAHAQQFCGDRTMVTERLQSKWGEQFAGGGLQNTNNVFEVWMSEENGTWTILQTNANGKSCVMASGTNWREGEMTKKLSGVKS